LKKNIFFIIGLSLLSLVSCKKETTNIGKDGLDSSLFLESEGIDTFQLETYTIVEDSLISSNLSVAMLGSYNDPEFGTVESEFYTQFRLPGFNPDFGDLNEIVIDSFVLGLEYRGIYGEMDPQKLEVYELNEDIYKDSTYYSFQTKAVKSTNWVMAANEIITPNPDGTTIIGSETVESQLRIFLDTNIARSFMTEASTNPSSFATNEAFTSYFKGLNVRVNNGNQALNEGAIMYFNLEDPLSKLTIYYKQAGLAKTFDFLINSECADFNHVTIDNSSTNVANVIANPSFGKKSFYAQANRSRAVVKFSTINDIPKNAVIHQAILELPVSYYSQSSLTPSLILTASTRIKSTDENLYNLNVTAEYSYITKSYKLDVRDYVQQVVNQKIENLGVYLSPTKMLSSVERIVFNGTDTDNKNKPKIHIIYTNY
jgi:hypothetical protein